MSDTNVQGAQNEQQETNSQMPVNIVINNDSSSSVNAVGVGGVGKQKMKRINKWVFVWVCAAAGGWLGIDRFVRGQAGLGLLKLFTVGGVFILWVIDFILALSKANATDEDELVFINGQYS